MGLRQPSATGAFFAQVSAGAKRQAEAREKVKKPQALGGSAGAGTAMIAAGTEAQKTATQNVQATGQKAATELKADDKNLTSSTAQAIAGTPTATPPDTITNGAGSDAIAGEPKPPPPPSPFTGGISAGNVGEGLTVSSGESGDVEVIQEETKQINDAIASITKQIEELNSKLSTANAEDSKKINDEKERLDKLLQSYQDKLTKENLGQIGGLSAFGQEMLDREKLLASEGGEVGKVAALFGRKKGDLKTSRYGALESQIYGKDLEAIQEAAKAGLIERGEAESEADTALEGYTKTLEEGKKSYEESIKTAQDRLNVLKATPQELAGYTRDELKKLFNNNDKLVDALFTFDKDNKVTGTTQSKVRDALIDRSTKLKAESLKSESATNKAKQVRSEQLKNLYMPVDAYGNPIVPGGPSDAGGMAPSSSGSDFYTIKNNINAQGDEQTKNSMAFLENQLKNAIDKADKAEAERVMGLIRQLYNSPGAIGGLNKGIAPSTKPTTQEKVVEAAINYIPDSVINPLGPVGSGISAVKSIFD